MRPGAIRDLRNARRQIKGARTSLSNLRIALRRSSAADDATLAALIDLAHVLYRLDEIGRMEAKR